MARETVMLNPARRPKDLKDLRELKNLALRDAEMRLPCGRSMLSMLERGERSQCSAALGHCIEELYGVPHGFLFVPKLSTKRHDTSPIVAA